MDEVITGRPPREPGPSYALARRIAEVLVSKRAEGVCILDLRALPSACDYFVIASGLSEVQVKALAEHVEDAIGGSPRRAQGAQTREAEARWARRGGLQDAALGEFGEDAAEAGEADDPGKPRAEDDGGQADFDDELGGLTREEIDELLAGADDDAAAAESVADDGSVTVHDVEDADAIAADGSFAAGDEEDGEEGDPADDAAPSTVDQKDAGVSAGVGGAQPLGETPGEPERASIGTQREGGLPRVGLRPWHVEGRQNRRWILLDYVDVVVHLFHRETRDYYRLENLWAEAPREDVTEAQARPVSGREDE